ncbi:SLAP domain-containing protein [Lactobacillus sp. ESL0791]|uniref:SLAP domain-containing protein n=1 Tax=Lactobacillus sp. ESL0791 TaxID=2983234 RepID=UPI0035ABAE2D
MISNDKIIHHAYIYDHSNNRISRKFTKAKTTTINYGNPFKIHKKSYYTTTSRRPTLSKLFA